MFTTFTRTCTDCGQTAKIAAFRTSDGKLRKQCKQCYAKQKRREKKRRVKRQDKAREEKVFLRLIEKAVDEAPLRAILKQIDRDAQTHVHRLTKYQQKKERNEASSKTLAALERQNNWVNYYNDLKDVVVSDFRRGALKPYLHYRSNTFLMYMHGLRYTYDDRDRAYALATA